MRTVKVLVLGGVGEGERGRADGGEGGEGFGMGTDEETWLNNTQDPMVWR